MLQPFSIIDRPMEKRKILLTVFIAALLFALSSCGDDSDQVYFYSVNVVNNAGAAITVRYDWDYYVWTYEWLGEVTIQQGDSQIIEWSSADVFGEKIEVEYLGIKKSYTVSQVDTITVRAQDFQN